MPPASSLKEIKGIFSRRTYYQSARVMLALVRADMYVCPKCGPLQQLVNQETRDRMKRSATGKPPK
ncbi:hypothetical protein E6H24_04945 [Candidatus Bathyarchaeota archaeon]|nr:MAG: hypothetical protein E6H24_04945 [Candidatus Bathyarchaeota archaeon]